MLNNNNMLLGNRPVSISAGSLIIDGTVGSYSGDQTKMSYLEEGSIKAYSPRLLWRDGKTYWAYQSYWQSTPGGQVQMLVYDERYGFDRPYMVGDRLTANDAHSVPSIAIDTDGRIHIVQEQSHVSPFNYYRADVVGDYNDFSKGSNIGTAAAYAHPMQREDGSYVIYHRANQGGPSKAAAKFTSASGFDGPWTGPTLITDNTAGSDFNRHYVTLPLHHYYNGEYYLLVTNRLETEPPPGVVTWYKFYLLVTSDFITFRNYQNTYSKNISTSGAITVGQLDTNFRYWITSSNSTQGYIPVAAVSPQGKFYAIAANGDNNYYLIYYDGGWQSQAVTTPNIVAIEDLRGGNGNDGGVEYVIPFGDFDILKIAYIDEGDYVKPHIFRTTNRGVTWEDRGDMLPTIDDDILGVMIPNNFFDMPFYRNFPIYFLSEDESASVTPVNKVYFKKAAFGAIQLETGTITPASNLNHASGLFHYKAVDADITRSGTNVLSLVDKFGLRNATAVNNPQWNSSDMITLDGSTNYFNVSSTGLSTLTKFTYMVVAKCDAGVNGIGVSFSNNTVNNLYIALYPMIFSFNSAYWQYSNGATSNNYPGADVINDDGVHLVTFCGDGRGKIDIYIDGKKQFYNQASYTHFGNGPNAISGINAVRIGGIDRTSDVFSNLKFKEMALYGDVLDLETLRSFQKKLCDDYGITYQDHFQ